MTSPAKSILENLKKIKSGTNKQTESFNENSTMLKQIASHMGSGWVFQEENSRMGSYDPCIEYKIKNEKYFFISIDGNELIFFTNENVDNKDYSSIYTELDYNMNLKALGKTATNYKILADMCLSIFNESKNNGFKGDVQHM